MFIKIEDKEIEKELKVLIKKILKDQISYKWLKDVVEDEIRKVVRVSIKKR